jgi:hypothetical protein
MGPRTTAQRIQAAIDHAIANNQAGILIPAGTYRVSRMSFPGLWI